MKPEEIEDWTEKIGKMSHIEMAKLHRFAPAGHPVFDTTLPLNEIFSKRFKGLGGFTPEISKRLGW